MGHIVQAEEMHCRLDDMPAAARAAQGLAIKGKVALRAGRGRHVRQGGVRQCGQGWDKELGKAAGELSAIDGGTDQGEGIGAGQAGA